MREPYYGFSCLENCFQLQEIVDYAKGKTDRRLMLGTAISARSLHGMSVKRPKRTLEVDQVRGIYSSTDMKDNLFPVVHFASIGSISVDSELLLIDRLLHHPSDGREIVILNQMIKGFQINNALPFAENLLWFQKAHLWQDKYEIILQLGHLAIDVSDDNPKRLARLVKAYEGVIDYVLLDISGGQGISFNPLWASHHLRAIAKACPSVSLGVAGGLGPDTMDLLEDLADEFPNLSIDAEKHLRDDEDNFDVGKAKKYFDRAVRIFEKNRNRK